MKPTQNRRAESKHAFVSSAKSFIHMHIVWKVPTTKEFVRLHQELSEFQYIEVQCKSHVLFQFIHLFDLFKFESTDDRQKRISARARQQRVRCDIIIALRMYSVIN